jgi:hypothetical protein
MTTTTSPYADAYAEYWDAGWRGILPLPYGQKAHPPTGYTGYDGADPSYADCATWAMDGQRNLALHLPTDVVGIDVDAYDDKVGGDTLAELVDKYGPLPPTFLSTSRRDGISGIRVYRVPPGTVLPTKLPGIEFIQKHHRYIVAAPSVHPNGGVYRWIDERTGLDLSGVPRIDDVPMLPAAWVGGLEVESRHAIKADIDAAKAAVILGEMPGGDPCDHILRHAGKALSGGDRHDSYNEAVLAVVGAGRRGCPGARPTVARLRKAFVAEISAPGERATVGEAEAEWKRSLMGAIAIVADEEQGTVCPDDVFQWVESLQPTGAEVTEDGEVVEETPYDREVRRRYAELRINEDAKAMLAALQAGQAPPLDGLTLREFLSQPDEEERYRVNDLWPAEGRILLAAAAKSGKTTMVAANLIPSLVDGKPFLGRHAPQRVAGSVALLNMEVGERTLRRWLRDSGTVGVEQVVVANLRGKASALALASDAGRRRFADFLKSRDTELVILDPLAPVLASLGLDENSNSDVARFFGWWSEALALAGVVDDIVVHHTGHAGERSRGASRLLDEPDAIWTLTREKSDDEDDPYGPVETRYLAAYGRDVDMAAEALAYDTETRSLSLTGQGRGEVRGTEVEMKVMRALKDGKTLTRNGIYDQVRGNRKACMEAVDRLLERDLLLDTGRKSTNGYPLLGRTDG